MIHHGHPTNYLYPLETASHCRKTYKRISNKYKILSWRTRFSRRTIPNSLFRRIWDSMLNLMITNKTGALQAVSSGNSRLNVFMLMPLKVVGTVTPVPCHVSQDGLHRHVLGNFCSRKCGWNLVWRTILLTKGVVGHIYHRVN